MSLKLEDNIPRNNRIFYSKLIKLYPRNRLQLNLSLGEIPVEISLRNYPHYPSQFVIKIHQITSSPFHYCITRKAYYSTSFSLRTCFSAWMATHNSSFHWASNPQFWNIKSFRKQSILNEWLFQLKIRSRGYFVYGWK